MFSTEQARGHDNIGIHGPEWHFQKLRGAYPPMFRFAQRILVADHHRRPHLLAKLDQAMVGIGTQHEADIALGKFLRDIGNARGQKAVVAQVRVRIKRHRRKENDHRFSQLIPHPDRNVQSGIIQPPLRSLHPVDDALSPRVGCFGAANHDAGIGADFAEFHRIGSHATLGSVEASLTVWAVSGPIA